MILLYSGGTWGTPDILCPALRESLVGLFGRAYTDVGLMDRGLRLHAFLRGMF